MMYPQNTKIIREQLEKDIEAFLTKGGDIEEIPEGMTSEQYGRLNNGHSTKFSEDLYAKLKNLREAD